MCRQTNQSFYSYDAICTLLEFNLDEYIEARNVLISKDLIAFDGNLFQVLDLPKEPLVFKKDTFTEDDL